MRKLFCVIYLTFALLFTIAQDVGISEWRYHIPYQQGLAVADAGSYVYCASELGMYYFSKIDNSVNRMTRVQGLSDIGITDIAHNIDQDIVVVVYSNGNIDLLRGEEVVNMEDLKRSNFPGSKRINSIAMKNEFAYLSCGFGVIVINLKKQEVKETITLNTNGDLGVNDIISHSGLFYAATNEGLYFAQESSNNLSDPNEWTIVDELPDSTFSSLFVLDQKLHANYDNNIFNSDTLFYLENGAWQKRAELFGLASNHFDVKNDKVVVCHTDRVIVYDKLWKSTQELLSYGQVAPLAAQAVFDKTNNETIWLADERKGLVEIISANQHEAHTIFGPISNRVHEITTLGNDVWIASGSVEGGHWNNTYNKDGVFKFSDNEWKTYNRNSLVGIDSLFDFLSVAIDPKDHDKVYFAVHGDGIVEMIGEVHTETFGQSNSSISLVEAATPSYQYAGMSSLTFDGNNILWGANARAANVLCAKDEAGKWYSFRLSEAISNKETGRMIATSDNNIWVTFPNNSGIAVFDYNNTIDDSDDDEIVGLTTANGNLPNNSVYALAEDLDGAIWIGTGTGTVVFRSPADLFGEDPPEAEKPLIQQDGYTEYLLESQVVTAIAIDGANRKWFGTSSSGVYLIAEDGTEEILHFTVENSPLLSNGILTIGVNHETGEVFFGTEQGICSYKSTATGGKADYSAVYAYPNPVEPNYYGDIAITGLVANSEIRITDISGNLVYQGIADGGQAVWNGKRADGNRIKTGVYLVFCAAPDGSQSVATKILFIN
ncbi:MAG: hypothetical protein HOB26_04190 [Flavobacteriales bacterium]|nr:hypothetical protein [Flavobacteriales bacterium]